MARVLLVAGALVLCLSFALAVAGRVLEYQEVDAAFDGAPAQAPQAASPSGHVPAVPGGIQERGGGAIADILWFVLKWANEAPAAGRRKDH